MILRSIALRQGRRAVARSTRLIHSTATQLQQQEQFDISSYPISSRVQPPVDDKSVARDYAALKRHKEITNSIGSTIGPHYQPHTQVTNPPSPEEITLELLLASQSHLGHSTSLWNPANARYIFGVRQGIHIISLDQTASHLRRACAVVRGVTERGGLVLFVGTREGQGRAVVKAAQLSRGCHLFDRWIPGSITNGPQILGRCRTKVVDENDKEIKGFEEQLEAKGALRPDLVVCLNPLENYVLLHECGLNNIPTIGVIDTDANPTWVTYPIPANDDSLRCINLIAGVLGRAGEQGQAYRLRQASRGEVTYRFNHGLQVPTADAIAAAHSAEQSALASDIPEETPNDRTVTSSTPAIDTPEVQEAVDTTMLSALEYASFADFDPEAIEAAIDMHYPDSAGKESPELADLRQKLRQSRSAFGMENRGDDFLQSEKLDPNTGAELEEMTQDMLDEPLTSEEAATLHAQDGGQGANPYEGGSYRAVLNMRQAALLRQMIAVKRRSAGEELSEEDKAELKKVDEARKNAPKIDEGDYALKRTS